ncbi:hypothetical protein [Patulibacter americanus]|uniref:hypothetical protein n=1 Tax=Patulibacter americanus TaxID=588672 RepID=UPI0003B5ADFC|nr:hypothetical protein [Patulibacter americanus]
MPSFFEMPPPPVLGHVAKQPRYKRPGWQGRPTGEMPGVVPVEAVIAATERVAVAVSAVFVYADGLSFDVVVMSSLDEPDDGPDVDPMLYTHHHEPISGAIPDEMLRIGVALSDGRKATNLTPPPFRPVGDDVVVLRPGGGGGSSERYEQTYWVWPLPADGALTIVCEWPAHGVPETAYDLDGAAVLAAANRSRVVFSDDHLPEFPEPGTGGGGWASYS